VASQENLRAVNAAVKRLGADKNSAYLPLISYMRSMARQIDAAGPEGPSARVTSAYGSALKDFQRAFGPAGTRGAAAAKAVEAAPTGPRAVEESPLEKLRKQRKTA
jgi:hypothetical protein